MIWLLRNIRNRAKFAIRNPGYALDSFLREITFADERFIASITGASSRRIRHFLDEPATTQDFAEHLRASEKQFRSASIESADLFAKKILNQYVAVRAFAPECIVETGIANGVSLAYLLLALHKNGRGSLHSIGLEDPSFLPAGKSVG